MEQFSQLIQSMTGTFTAKISGNIFQVPIMLIVLGSLLGATLLLTTSHTILGYCCLCIVAVITFVTLGLYCYVLIKEPQLLRTERYQIVKESIEAIALLGAKGKKGIDQSNKIVELVNNTLPENET